MNQYSRENNLTKESMVAQMPKGDGETDLVNNGRKCEHGESCHWLRNSNSQKWVV